MFILSYVCARRLDRLNDIESEDFWADAFGGSRDDLNEVGVRCCWDKLSHGNRDWKILLSDKYYNDMLSFFFVENEQREKATVL